VPHDPATRRSVGAWRAGRSDCPARASSQVPRGRKLVEDAEGDLPSSASVAASLAVLAGIAASDAACFAALGRRSRGQSHHAAGALLKQIAPGGTKAAQAFSRLIDLKDTAHYGIINVTASKLKNALRDASQLVDFAAQVLNR
jgi:hypothetical protein